MHAFLLKPYAHNFEIINLYERQSNVFEGSVRRAPLSPLLSKLDLQFSTKRNSTPWEL